MAALRDINSFAAFERAQLRNAADFQGRLQLYRYALSRTVNEDRALFLEFGVQGGFNQSTS